MKKLINHPNRYIAIGVAVGAAIGVLNNSLATGLAIGIVVGIILTGREKQKNKDKDE